MIFHIIFRKILQFNYILKLVSHMIDIIAALNKDQLNCLANIQNNNIKNIHDSKELTEQERKFYSLLVAFELNKTRSQMRVNVIFFLSIILLALTTMYLFFYIHKLTKERITILISLAKYAAEKLSMILAFELSQHIKHL